MTTRLIRLLDSTTTVLGANRVEAIAGTSTKARDGHVVEMRGMDTSAFLRSGTILWGHDPDQPVGIPVSGRVDSAGNLRLTIDFAPGGASARADEIRDLVKAGIVRNLSIGFDVLEAEPLDPKNPRGGMRVTRSELLEVSFVSVPADPLAVVTARANRAGKALSAANASALRAAHDMAERCRAVIANVLGGAGEGLDDDGEQEAQRQDRDHRRRQAEALALAGVAHQHVGDATYDRRQRQLEAIALAGIAHQHLGDAAIDRRQRQREVARLRFPPR